MKPSLRTAFCLSLLEAYITGIAYNGQDNKAWKITNA